MSVARSVHRLDIVAPSATLARRAGLLVEDALRTASLPGDGAELVLVRSLTLPAFQIGVSAQGVALGLESAFRMLSPIDGRDADDTRLDAARAVRFADRLEAHLALGVRLLAGTPPRAWCWALAVPGYRPDAGTGAGLRSIALSLARLEEAPAALGHWFARMVAGHGVERLLPALGTDDAMQLLHACSSARPTTPGHASEAPAWARAGAWVAQTFTHDDPRRILFESMAAARGCATAAHPRAEEGGAGAARSSEGMRQRSAPSVPDTPGAPAPPDDTHPGPAAASLRQAGDEAAGRPHTHGRADRPPAPSAPEQRTPSLAQPASGSAAQPQSVPATPGRPATRTTATRDGQQSRTDAPHAARRPGDDAPPAGNVHRSAAPAPRTETPPASAVPPAASTLRPPGAAHAADARGTSPAPSSLPPAPPSPASRSPAPTSPPAHAPTHSAPGIAPAPRSAPWAAAPHAIDAPTRAGGLLFLLPVLAHIGFPAWLAGQGARAAELPAQVLGQLLQRLHIDDDDPAWALGRVAATAAAQAHATHWLTACRRHLRLNIGIGPASLCLRPARMLITPTHADVRLELAQLDIRIRRAGLDIDPGWVPWFGRVLRFHYGEPWTSRP